MEQNDLISQCLMLLGLANDAQNVGAISQAQGYLVDVRELMNKQTWLEAGGSNRTPESTDHH